MLRLNKGAANKIFFLTSLLKQFQTLKCCRNRTPIYSLPRGTPLGFTVLFGVKVQPRITGCAWLAHSSSLLQAGTTLQPLLAVKDHETFEDYTPAVFQSVPQFGFIYVIFSHDQSEAVQFWSVRHTYHRGDACLLSPHFTRSTWRLFELLLVAVTWITGGKSASFPYCKVTFSPSQLVTSPWGVLCDCIKLIPTPSFTYEFVSVDTELIIPVTAAKLTNWCSAVRRSCLFSLFIQFFSFLEFVTVIYYLL